MPDVTQYIKTARSTIRRLVQRNLYPDRLLISRQYRSRNGFYPDLKNPKELSEKLQWLKLNDRSPLHTMCADKIRARDYVAARVGPEVLSPAYLITYDIDDIRPDRIPQDKFVLKTNHDQGGVFICRDRAAFDWDKVRADVGQRMTQNKYLDFREYQYKNVKPGVLVEALMEGENGEAPREVRLYCIHGKPTFIEVVQERFGDRRESFYDPDWKRMLFIGRSMQPDEALPRPPYIDRLMAYAERLAEPFLFCRVDFLNAGGDECWFGEITFYHAAGLLRFTPLDFERRFGEMVDLSRLDESKRLQTEIYASVSG